MAKINKKFKNAQVGKLDCPQFIFTKIMWIDTQTECYIIIMWH